MADRKGLRTTLQNQSPVIYFVSSSFSTYRACCQLGTKLLPPQACGPTLYSSCQTPIMSFTELECQPKAEAVCRCQPLKSKHRKLIFFYSSPEISLMFRRITHNSVTLVMQILKSAQPAALVAFGSHGRVCLPCSLAC